MTATGVNATAALARDVLAAALEVEAAELGPAPSIETLPAWDSLAHVRVVLAVEGVIGRELDPDAVAGLVSLAAIVQAFDAQGGAAALGKAAKDDLATLPARGTSPRIT